MLYADIINTKATATYAMRCSLVASRKLTDGHLIRLVDAPKGWTVIWAPVSGGGHAKIFPAEAPAREYFNQMIENFEE